MFDRPVVVLDFETTGLSGRDRVIEIAAIRIEAGRETEFHRLCNPGFPLPERITEITGLTDADLAGAPAPHVAIRELHETLLADAPLFVAHNASFDLRFLLQEYRHAGLPAFAGPVLCTRNLARGVYPALGSYRLGDLVDYLGIRMDRAHRALDDVRATYAALTRMLQEASARGLDPFVYGGLAGTRYDGSLRGAPQRAESAAASEVAPRQRAEGKKTEPYMPRAMQRFLQMVERKGRK
jgi:DNA polymerase III alpha subunit (gram-positive type)